MENFPAESGTTRLQLQFQESFFYYVPCHDAFSKLKFVNVGQKKFVLVILGMLNPNLAYILS